MDATVKGNTLTTAVQKDKPKTRDLGLDISRSTKRIKFAEGLAKGLTIKTAYLQAGYAKSGAVSQAYKLAKNPEILKIIEATKAKALRNGQRNLNRLLDRFESAWDRDLTDDDRLAKVGHAVIKAGESYARLAGLEPARQASVTVNGQVNHTHSLAIPLTSLIQNYLQSPTDSGGIIDLGPGEYQHIEADNRALSAPCEMQDTPKKEASNGADS